MRSSAWSILVTAARAGADVYDLVLELGRRMALDARVAQPWIDHADDLIQGDALVGGQLRAAPADDVIPAGVHRHADRARAEFLLLKLRRACAPPRPRRGP